jgi:hypothetical protein
MYVNTNTFQTGLGCAVGFGTMHAHRSTVKRKMVGKGINCFIHTGLM